MRFFLALALCSSLAAAADLAGDYVLHGVLEMAAGMTLRPDGTFEFGLVYGAAEYESKGKWKRDGDAVVLTADKVPGEPFRLVKSSRMSEPGVRVWVKAPGGGGVPNIDVELDGRTHRTNSEGAAEFPEAKLPASVKILVPVYSLEAGPFALPAPSNDVVFEINADAITRVPFNNERLRIVGDTLELRYFDRNRAMKFERQAAR